MRKAATAAAILMLSALSVTASRAAFAGLDCPPGTIERMDVHPRCEPTICVQDGQCSPDEVCRSIPLCIEINQQDGGAPGKDGGIYLVATQRCGPEKSCPTHQSCLDGKRCVRKTLAAQIGLMAAPAEGADGGATATGEPAKKGGCGCTVVGGYEGAGSNNTTAWAAFAGLALVIGSRGFRSRRGRLDAQTPPKETATRTR